MSGAPISPWSRRQFLVRAGVLAAIAQVPALLRSQGWLQHAKAVEADVVRDTFNALVAFVIPGPDDYSRAQGEWSTTPGGLAAGTTDFLLASVDGYLPMPDVPAANDDTVPLSAAVTALLNTLALTINPVATAGPFLSPFARLRFSDKAEVFRQIEALEGDADLPEPFTASSGNLRFIAGALLEFAAFGTYTEWGSVGDDGHLAGRPVGWDLSSYGGISDGWDELRGYWGGRRKARRT